LHNPDLYKYTTIGKIQLAQSEPRKANTLSSTNLKKVSSNNIAGRVAKMQRLENEKRASQKFATTQHWETNYQTINRNTVSAHGKQAERPFWSYPKRAHLARRTFYKTEYENTLGTYGHNPRKILDHKSTKMENDVNELTMGSTKVTRHVPGYGGYLVKTDLNDKALIHGRNESAKDLMKNKINLNENFNVKIPGYSGYKPLSCLNDRGTVRPKLFSTHGEKFY
jgi:hypothetical protein